VKGFVLVFFRHVKRVLNDAAHLLAKSYTHVNSSFVSYSVPDLSGELFVLMWFNQ
jgi:predicted component of type VI protein secretion system